MNECVDIFEVASKDTLKEKMNIILISDDLWKKWLNAFEIYKNGSLACSPKSIMEEDYVHNKIRKYASNIFRPLCDLDKG